MTAFSAWGLTLRQVRSDTTIHTNNSSYSQLNPSRHQRSNHRSDTEYTSHSIIDQSDNMHCRHQHQYRHNRHSIGCLASTSNSIDDRVVADEKEEMVVMETATNIPSITASAAVTSTVHTRKAKSLESQ
ncbi:hypothetical protein BDF22DRAFT_743411 [Syncephalis plumigaleata]|nr:hypothetical protein BDF22DRAFT_743411 [Syncephalis plumigaleata]